jgi:hypothetical protein
MRALPITPLLLGLVALSGCPSSDGNPSVLWLATDVVETRVKLVASEPPPF